MAPRLFPHILVILNSVRQFNFFFCCTIISLWSLLGVPCRRIAVGWLGGEKESDALSSPHLRAPLGLFTNEWSAETGEPRRGRGPQLKQQKAKIRRFQDASLGHYPDRKITECIRGLLLGVYEGDRLRYVGQTDFGFKAQKLSGLSLPPGPIGSRILTLKKPRISGEPTLVLNPVSSANSASLNGPRVAKW